MADQTDDYVKALQGLSPADQAAMQPETFANPLVKQKIDNFVNTLSIPGQAFNSEMPVTTEDMLQPARDLTGTLARGGVPMAKAGSAGIFGGKLAAGADMKALQEAEKMRMGGVHPDDVWRDTGWYRPATDNQWKFEIPDNQARMMGHGLPYAEDGSAITGPSKVMLPHDKLYSQYPVLGDLKMRNTVYQNPANGIGQGQFSPTAGIEGHPTIEVMAPDLKNATSIGLHELQHGAQGIEGFSPGANSSYYAGQIEKGLRAKPELGAWDYDAIQKQAQDLYHRTAGEVEARNVQTRMAMTPNERKIIAPQHTQDVPYSQQMIFDPVAQTLRALRDVRGNKT